jgi:hypothetical protein
VLGAFKDEGGFSVFRGCPQSTGGDSPAEAQAFAAELIQLAKAFIDLEVVLPTARRAKIDGIGKGGDDDHAAHQQFGSHGHFLQLLSLPGTKRKAPHGIHSTQAGG